MYWAIPSLSALQETLSVATDISKGSGSFTFENRELFYTIKEEILVDRFEKKLSLEYEKNEDFNRGVHKVVLYTRNYIIGSSEFLVK